MYKGEREKETGRTTGVDLRGAVSHAGEEIRRGDPTEGRQREETREEDGLEEKYFIEIKLTMATK